jgi:hypothetical protein
MNSNFEQRAARRYPNSKEMQSRYIDALVDCKLNPAYYTETPFGRYPCNCRPYMEDDVKEWQVVKRRVHVKKVKTQAELESEADLKSWDDIEHYGRATYVYTQPSIEHNGALFDIGSRF